MKKLLFVGALALGAAACDPEVAQDPVPEVGVAEFNPTAVPAVVPSPNDLAINQETGLVNAPIDPNAPPAQQEFTRDYLNTLNGFPPTAIANTKVLNLNPSTLTNNVIVLDLYKGTPLATADINPIIGYNPATGYINVIPQDAKTGANAWPKGGRYAVALIGGDNGLKTNDGKNIIPSATWAFVSSPTSLVTCEDLTAPDCRTVTEIIPSSKSDPAERLADQTASALRLEQLRRGYLPIFKALVDKGIKREDIVLVWTFTITNQPEATFDPTTSTIPFPNNLVRTPDVRDANGAIVTRGHLNLPVPPDAGIQTQLFEGLNTLDGFSTTGAIVSENSDARGALDFGALDPTTLAGSVQVFNLTNPAAAPSVAPCLNCASSLLADGGVPSSPQQLQIVPQVPLNEATQYGVVLTTNLKSTTGRRVAPAGAFALLRMANPLVDANGKSLVSGIPDGSAAALEPIRQAHKPFFDALDAAGIKRSQIALGWTFTTQSINSVAKSLYSLPSQLPPTVLPNVPLWLKPAASTPSGFEGRLYSGEIVIPNLLTDPRGTFNPDPTKLRGERVPYLLSLPPLTATKPANGWPVVIYTHGTSSSRETMTEVAGRLASEGFATIAIDTVFHGERSNCAGISAAQPIVLRQPNGTPIGLIDSPDEACVDSTTDRCETDPASASYGRCVARTQSDICDPTPGVGDYSCGAVGKGRCVAQRDSSGTITGGLCEGSTFLARIDPDNAPAISGWNYLDLVNLFATRDHFRQHIIDIGQLVRVLQATSTGNFNQRLAALSLTDTIDSSQIHFVGQSLGGMLGTMSTSVSPAIQKSVLNAPGGGLVSILMTAPDFAPYKKGFTDMLGTLGIRQGSPTFDQFLGLANTILDPADPRNYAFGLENPTPAVTGREVLIQMVKGDTTFPNATTAAVLSAANRTDARTVASYIFDPANNDDITIPAQRPDLYHYFLTYAPAASLRTDAQTQLVEFLKTGNMVAPQ